MLRTFSFLALTLIAGALTVFAFAPFRLFWLMPLLLAVPALLAQRAPRHAFLFGYLWGLAAYTSNFHWIYNSLHDIAGLPMWIAAPLVLLLPAYLALYPGLATWFAVRVDTRPWLRWVVAFPAVWMVTEWLRSWVLTGFPWGAVGYSQITESPLAGFAPVTGTLGVTYAVALSAGLLALLPLVKWRGQLLAVVLGLALWNGGHWLKGQEWTTPVGKPLKVALAQGNVPQSLKWDPANFESSLARYYQMVATTQADLMILPETALPVFLGDLPSGYLTMLNSAAATKKMALATGIPRRTPDGRGYLNAVVALSDPAQPYYAKDHLVPFGEFVPLPLVTGWIYQFMNMPLSGFTGGGRDQAPLSLAGQQVAFNVCYEDSFGDELIGPAAHATLLANVSNLAWFGQSNAMSQHLQLSQARALEMGRYMMRATNTGMTAIVRPNGEIGAVAAPDTEQVLVGTVTGRTGLTPYMRHGDLPVLLLSGALMLLTLLAGWWRQRRG